MGQVYHATDTKLNRQVALKILPEAFATDPDRLARFQREAQVLASLNHPNIAAIYGIEEADDTRALVLELVEGPTLADRIAQGAIPLDEALPIAKQIAEALEAAHEAGVIHRDLKPANIKVRDDGTVKVLDFGLAKALDTTPQGDPSQSPTLTAAATQMGVIMGTAAYMSPEQAKGRTVDRRSDVWAFGAVLYEMLAGRRAFVGNDVSDTLVSVFRDDPDWAALPDDMPSRVLQAVQVCLQKDPKQRVRDISAVRLAMEGGFESASAARAEELKATQLFGWRHVGLAALAGVVIGGVGVGMAPQGSSVPAARGVTRLAIPLPAGAYFSRYGGLALSPDGRTLVYAANLGGDRLYRRDLDELEAEPIAATEGARGPFFSPDGASLGFIATAGDLRKLPLDGGLPVPLAPATNQSSGTWGDDDAIYFRPFDSRGLARIRSAGGEAVPIVQSDEEILGWPDVLPGANAVLFSTYPENFDGARVVVESLVTGERRVLAAGTTPRFLSSGHVVFAREDTLWAAAFDAERLELASEPVPVVENVYINSSNGQAFYTVSAMAHSPMSATFVRGLSGISSGLIGPGRKSRLALQHALTGGLACRRTGTAPACTSWIRPTWIRGSSIRSGQLLNVERFTPPPKGVCFGRLTATASCSGRTAIRRLRSTGGRRTALERQNALPQVRTEEALGTGRLTAECWWSVKRTLRPDGTLRRWRSARTVR